jgi:hypothetical protein
MRAFKRPSDALQAGVQTVVQTPFRRYGDGIQTDYSHTPHTPQALRAPLGAFGRPRGRLSAGMGNASSAKRAPTTRRGQSSDA